MRIFAALLPLATLSGCVASLDTAARARGARDLSCPENQLVVEYLDRVGSEHVQVTGCGAAARYTCVISEGAAGRYSLHRVCIREADPLKEMVGTEEIRTPAK